VAGQVEHGVAPGWTDMFCDDNALLDTAESRGLKSVLCVGCGVSQEPLALAAAGLQVTAMDLSPFALRCVARLAEGSTRPADSSARVESAPAARSHLSRGI